MKEFKFSFTVFTATYNRANLLPRVYKGLCDQSFKDFEWIIIDDGSTDNTKEVVEKFLNDNIFNIRYYYQQNMGKHIAYLAALNMADGLFFLPLDSDDIPLPNALKDLYDGYFQIPETERTSFSAVTGLCVDNKGKVIGDKFPEEIFDSTPLDLYFKYNVTGDKWGFQLTEIRRKFSFPIIPDEKLRKDMKFYPEIAIFGEIGKKFKTRYINKPVKRVEYHNTGLSQSKVKHAYPKKISALYRLNYCANYFFYSPKEFIVSMILYNRWSLHSSTIKFSEIRNISFRVLTVILFPVSWLIFLRDIRTKN